jgi:hypothetical protein
MKKNSLLLLCISCIFITFCDNSVSKDKLDYSPQASIKILENDPSQNATVTATQTFHVKISYEFDSSYGSGFNLKPEFLDVKCTGVDPDVVCDSTWYPAPMSNYTTDTNTNIIEFDYTFPTGLDLSNYFNEYFQVKFSGYYLDKNNQTNSLMYINNPTLIYYKSVPPPK